MESKKKNFFLMIVGIAIIILSIAGGTFAFFTAQAKVNGTNTMTGNLVSLGFEAVVSLRQGSNNIGVIPMTDAMIEEAVKDTSSSGGHALCKDANGNDVCYIYQVDLTNKSSSVLFIDGFIDLAEIYDNDVNEQTSYDNEFKWVQVFPATSGSGFTTDGTGEFLATGTSTVTGADSGETTLSNTTLELGASKTNGTVNGITSYNTTATYTINGNSYNFISKNYARSSKTDSSLLSGNTLINTANFESLTNPANYIYFKNLYLNSSTKTNSSRTLYFAIWLSENGTSQNEIQGSNDVTNKAAFTGEAYFQTSESNGGGITATFGGSTVY